MKFPLLLLLTTVTIASGQINPDKVRKSGWIFYCRSGHEDNVPNASEYYHLASPYMPEPELTIQQHLAKLIESLQWFVEDAQAVPPRYTIAKLKERREKVAQAITLITQTQTYLGERL